MACEAEAELRGWRGLKNNQERAGVRCMRKGMERCMRKGQANALPFSLSGSAPKSGCFHAHLQLYRAAIICAHRGNRKRRNTRRTGITPVVGCCSDWGSGSTDLRGTYRWPKPICNKSRKNDHHGVYSCNQGRVCNDSRALQDSGQPLHASDLGCIWCDIVTRIHSQGQHTQALQFNTLSTNASKQSKHTRLISGPTAGALV
jgi:hypothetical protein